MEAVDSHSPPARYGFALRHPYGVSVLVLTFASVFVASDLVSSYAETGAKYPYAVAVPFIGLVMTLGLGIWLAIVIGGDIENPVAQSFLPLYAVGAGVWLVITASVAVATGEPVTTGVCLIGVLLIATVTKRDTDPLVDPDRVDASRTPWPGAVATVNAASIVALGALYTGTLPVMATHYVLVVYAVSTTAYPFALFADGYRHAAQRPPTWRFATLSGCLGVAGLVTLGTANWLITPLYAVLRVVSGQKRSGEEPGWLPSRL